jgi:hypothetical protein
VEPSDPVYVLRFDPALISLVLPIQDGKIADTAPTLLNYHHIWGEVEEPNLE